MSVLLSFLLVLSALSPAQAQDVDALSDLAVQNNPSVEAMRASTRSLQAQASVVGTWSDPMVSVEYSNTPTNSFGLSSHPMSGLQLRLQQNLHPPGWSRLQREASELKAEATGFGVQEAELQLRTTVGITWWMLRRTRELRKITEEHLARADELREAAESRYITGSVGQHAVLRLQVLSYRTGSLRWTPPISVTNRVNHRWGWT